jgi:hypothetical protein
MMLSAANGKLSVRLGLIGFDSEGNQHEWDEIDQGERERLRVACC